MQRDFDEPLYLGQGLAHGDWHILNTEERLRHLYVVGQTGTGKSTFLKSLFLQDVQAGRGATFIDPHGDAALEIADAIPKDRLDDVVFFDPADIYPIAFNPIGQTHPDHRSQTASAVLSCFKSQWADSWGPRLEYILRYCLHTLLDAPNEAHHTLLSISRLLTDDGFRAKVLRHVSDPVCRGFWRDEFGAWDRRQRTEAISPILNKVGAYAGHSVLRCVIGQAKSAFSLDDVLNQRRILIVSLNKGALGDDGVSLIGALLVSGLQQAAFRRHKQPPEARIDHALYIDEFQSFSSPDTFQSLFSEARKYRLSLVVSHQFLDQVHRKTLSAVIGNVGNLAVFSVGRRDAERLAPEFDPYPADRLTTLARGEFMLRARREGELMHPVAIKGLHEAWACGSLSSVIKNSRRRYGRNRLRYEVEERIARQYEPKRGKPPGPSRHAKPGPKGR